MLETHTIEPEQLTQLVQMRLPEAKALQLLQQLVPENLTLVLLHQLITEMRATSVVVPEIASDILDCCGTGGSNQSIFNTSTAAAFVLAAGGVPVVKFGNRAVSSRSGSSDFLECLGIPIQNTLERFVDVFQQCNLAFLHAPQCYPALAGLSQLRKQLGSRTVFNFLGPLLNPLNPSYRLLGVSHVGMQDMIGQYLQHYQPNLKQAYVVHHPLSQSTGLDEISPNGSTHILHLQQHDNTLLLDKKIITFPEDKAEAPASATPQQSAAIFQALLNGEFKESLYYRLLCINAGAGFVVAKRCANLEEGAAYAAELVTHGKVAEILQNCRRAYVTANH